MITDKVRPHHLERKALLYVRQSSAHQVLHNRESSALQYQMPQRLGDLQRLQNQAALRYTLSASGLSANHAKVVGAQ